MKLVARLERLLIATEGNRKLETYRARTGFSSPNDHTSQFVVDSSFLKRLVNATVLWFGIIMICGVVFQDAKARSFSRRPTKVITLERTVCFGTCPNYRLTIFSDGLVSYEGIRFVKKMGKATGRISRAKLKDLVQEFTSIDYFDLSDSFQPGEKTCPQESTDMPSATTSLTWQGRSKTITHYHGCRGVGTLELLTKLENKIDEAVNVKQWTGK